VTNPCGDGMSLYIIAEGDTPERVATAFGVNLNLVRDLWNQAVQVHTSLVGSGICLPVSVPISYADSSLFPISQASVHNASPATTTPVDTTLFAKAQELEALIDHSEYLYSLIDFSVLTPLSDLLLAPGAAFEADRIFAGQSGSALWKIDPGLRDVGDFKSWMADDIRWSLDLISRVNDSFAFATGQDFTSEAALAQFSEAIADIPQLRTLDLSELQRAARAGDVSPLLRPLDLTPEAFAQLNYAILNAGQSVIETRLA